MTGWLPGILVTALFLTPIAVSCKTDDAQQVKVVAKDSPPPPGTGPEKGVVVQDESDVTPQDIEKDQDSPESLAQRQKSKRMVFVKPGETPQLFSDWSSIVAEDLKALNDGKSFRYGEKWALSLTAAEYDEFERKRKEYWDKKRNEIYNQYDIKLVEYSVKRSDTMESIARKNKILLWFLAIHNPSVDPYKLSLGTKVFVPVLMNRKKLPAAEGGGGGDAEGNGGDSPGKGSLGASEKLVSGKSSKKGKTGKGVGSEVVEAPSEEGIPVIVKRGESLSSYTKWGGFTMEELERLNPGIGSRMLREGDTVRIPLTAEQFDQFQEKRAKGKRGKLTITPPGDVPPKEPASAP